MTTLKDDPDARALKPEVSRAAILNALIAGVLAGLAIAALAWSYGRPTASETDAGVAAPSFTLDTDDDDPEESGAPAWLDEPAQVPIAPEPAPVDPATVDPATVDPATVDPSPVPPAVPPSTVAHRGANQPSDQPPSTVSTDPLK